MGEAAQCRSSGNASSAQAAGEGLRATVTNHRAGEKYLDNPTLYLKWRPKVDQILSVSLESTWDNVVTAIDNYTLLSLEHCDNELSKCSGEGNIDGQQLQKIADRVVELMEEVRGDDIDSDITTYIIDRLEEILKAIDEFSLTGPVGVKRAIEENLGGFIIQKNIFMVEASEKEKSHLNTFFQTLCALAAVINITLGVPRLPQAIQQLALVEAPQTKLTEQSNKETPDDVIVGELKSSDEREVTNKASESDD